MGFPLVDCVTCGEGFRKRGGMVSCMDCRRSSGVCTYCSTPGSEFYTEKMGRCKTCVKQNMNARNAARESWGPKSPTKACADCGKAIWSGSTRCGSCANRARRVDVPCRLGGCTDRASLKGLCRRHYFAARDHKASARPCDWCGVVFRPWKVAAGRVCSLACLGHMKSLETRGGVKSTSSELVVWQPDKGILSRREDAKLRLEIAAAGSSGLGVVTVGRCRICRSRFSRRFSTPVPTCGSKACMDANDAEARREAKYRRRARLNDARVETVYRQRVFKRDGFRCHMCGRKTRSDVRVPHPLAVTLDHLVPLALGGEHSMRNVACACFECNSRKSHRLAGDQLALFG